MKIGDIILSVSRIQHIRYHDNNNIIEIFYDDNKILLERCLEKSDYTTLRNQIENEIKIYREKNCNIQNK